MTAPTLENDIYGCFLAHARGAKTIAFGTHITPIPLETMRPYPSLDFALVGEPDLTIRDLLDHLEGRIGERSPEIVRMFDKHDPMYKPSINQDGTVNMHGIKGIACRGTTISSSTSRVPLSRIWITCRSRCTNCCLCKPTACR